MPFLDNVKRPTRLPKVVVKQRGGVRQMRLDDQVVDTSDPSTARGEELPFATLDITFEQIDRAITEIAHERIDRDALDGFVASGDAAGLAEAPTVLRAVDRGAAGFGGHECAHHRKP